jgi:hypothetical protein
MISVLSMFVCTFFFSAHRPTPLASCASRSALVADNNRNSYGLVLRRMSCNVGDWLEAACRLTPLPGYTQAYVDDFLAIPASTRFAKTALS